MKFFRSAVLLLLCLAMLVSCNGGAPESDGKRDDLTETDRTAGDNDPEEAATLNSGILSVAKDGTIIDEKGDEVQLRGVNLGGWLIQETWMCAVQGSECNLDSFELLASRGFSDEQIKNLFLTYAENYLTEKDIEYLASLGVNCMRLPFWYRNFMDADLNFYSENDSENPGFMIIDDLISWAEQYRIYVILDMHGCPGGQSTDHTTGVIGKNELYVYDKYIDAMERLWVSIAEHYKDCASVAAYDIMNEPMNNNTGYEYGWAAGSSEAVSRTINVYDIMIKAIRAVDEKHIITVEGIWSADVLPNPAKYGWTNMMYQLHLYDTTAEMIDYRVNELVSIRERYGVAAYVGEFNNGDELQYHAYNEYVKHGLSYTMWTYKVSKDYLGNWGIRYADVPVADLVNDSYETIRSKWGRPLRSENFNINKTVEYWVKRFANK